MNSQPISRRTIHEKYEGATRMVISCLMEKFELREDATVHTEFVTYRSL
jgi:hypothetical protein